MMEADVLYIVDGYNLMFRVSGKHSRDTLEDRREALIKHLLNYLSFDPRAQLRLVFDAKGGSTPFESKSTHGRLTLVYADKEESADAAIVKFVARQSDRQNIKVVTDDREIRTELKRLRTENIRTLDFEKIMNKAYTRAKGKQEDQVLKKMREPGKLKENEVNDWMAEFGIEEDEIEG